MLEAGIDGLSRGNNLGGRMRGFNPLQFVPLRKGAMEKSDKLYPWLRSLWGDTLTEMEKPDWFEEEKIGDNLFLSPSPATMETELDTLLESRIKQQHKTYLVVVPSLTNFLWRRKVGKETNLIFTIPIGMTFWGLGEHEPVIIALFFPIVTRKGWRGPWNIIGSELEAGTAIDFEI